MSGLGIVAGLIVAAVLGAVSAMLTTATDKPTDKESVFSRFSAWWWRWTSVFRMSAVHECAVYWRSHGCCRENGHRGNHRCDCGDKPLKGDRLFDKHFNTLPRAGVSHAENCEFKSCSCSRPDNRDS